MIINSKKIKTVIVDDEPYALKCLRGLLGKDKEIEIYGECLNGFQAIEMLKHKTIDLIFLDIQMPELSGFDVLSSIDPLKTPVVIFVTAYDKYVLKALKFHALDYLLKPFTDEEFYNTLKQAKQAVYQNRKHYMNQQFVDLVKNHFNFFSEEIKNLNSENNRNLKSRKFLSRLPIPVNDQILLLNVKDIEWIEAEDNYVKIYTTDKSYLIRDTMNNLEEKLNPNEFFRIHRSAIVNMAYIKSLEPYFKGDYIVILNNGKRLKLTRNRKEQFKNLFKIPL